MRILVIGGAGFIGSHLVEKLNLLEYNVHVLDNFSTGSAENLSKKQKIIYGDTINIDLLNSILHKYDVVFHLAANSSIQECIKNPIQSHNNNLTSTLILLETCVKNNVKKFIFSSSAAVYGDIGKKSAIENFKPNPLNQYAIHKLASEYYAKIYNNLYGLETVCLRYFNVFGARQRKDSIYSGVITNFIDKIKNNQPIIINGDGEQSRDFCHVSNIVEANILAMNTKNIGGRCFNIGTGISTSINDLALELKSIFNKKIQIQHQKEKAGEIKFSCANIELAKKYLKYLPEVSFKKGLESLILLESKNK